MPIDRFVIVMQENRSFDHYFAALHDNGQPDADVRANGENPDRETEGILVPSFVLKQPCTADLPHDWVSVHQQWHGGAMDGFLVASKREGKVAMGHYDEHRLAYYYALASTFALADHYFASLLGPTWPNRMYLLFGTSYGHIRNEQPPPRVFEHSLFHQLEQTRRSWAIYSDQQTFEEQMLPGLRRKQGQNFLKLHRFFEAAQSGTLPNLAWVESTYGGPWASDEHPPGDIELGQRFVAEVVTAVMKSPVWNHSAILIMYDEHGGFYDHVPPPPACVPDRYEPLAHSPHPGERFDRYGIRVPFVVVSPFAKPHYVSHVIYDHTSVLRLIQARFGLPALTARDANATAPLDMFDFNHPAFLKPPELPPALVNQQELAECEAEFGPEFAHPSVAWHPAPLDSRMAVREAPSF